MERTQEGVLRNILKRLTALETRRLALPKRLRGDTGWVTVTLEAGFTGSLLIKAQGDTVWLRGSVTGSMTALVTTLVATIPSGYRPLTTQPAGSIFSNREYNWGNITTGGAYSVRKTTTGSSTLVIGASWKRA